MPKAEPTARVGSIIDVLCDIQKTRVPLFPIVVNRPKGENPGVGFTHLDQCLSILNSTHSFLFTFSGSRVGPIGASSRFKRVRKLGLETSL
jgi:hypothetical protein